MYLKSILAYPTEGGQPIRKANGPVCETGWLVTLERADLRFDFVLEVDVLIVPEKNLISGLRLALEDDVPISALNSLSWKFDSEEKLFRWKSGGLDTLLVVARSDIQGDDSRVLAVQGDLGSLLRINPYTLTISWPGGICDVIQEDVFFV
jgi:hypothetical protein